MPKKYQEQLAMSVAYPIDADWTCTTIPDEDNIKKSYKMRIPVWIDALENPYSDIHALE